MKKIETIIFENLEELSQAFKEGKLAGCSLIIDNVDKDKPNYFLTGSEKVKLSEDFEGNAWKMIAKAFEMLGIDINIL